MESIFQRLLNIPGTNDPGPMPLNSISNPGNIRRARRPFFELGTHRKLIYVLLGAEGRDEPFNIHPILLLKSPPQALATTQQSREPCPRQAILSKAGICLC